MNPYRLKNVFEYLTSNNQLLKKKLKLGTSEIPIPPKRKDVIDIEAINRFNKANPRVDTTSLKPLSVKHSNVRQSNVNEHNEGAIQSAFDTATRDAQFEGYPAPSYEKFKSRYLKKNMKAEGGRAGYEDGGMLVQPSDDGSRPGYAKSKKKYSYTNQFGTFESENAPPKVKSVYDNISPEMKKFYKNKTGKTWNKKDWDSGNYQRENKSLKGKKSKVVKQSTMNPYQKKVGFFKQFENDVRIKGQKIKLNKKGYITFEQLNTLLDRTSSESAIEDLKRVIIGDRQSPWLEKKDGVAKWKKSKNLVINRGDSLGNTYIKYPDKKTLKSMKQYYKNQEFINIAKRGELRAPSIEGMKVFYQDEDLMRAIRKWSGNPNDKEALKIINSVFGADEMAGPNAIKNLGRALIGEIKVDGIKVDKVLGKKILEGVTRTANGQSGRSAWDQAAYNYAKDKMNNIFDRCIGDKNFQQFFDEIDGILRDTLGKDRAKIHIDEVFSLRSGLTNNNQVYSVFSQIIDKNINSKVKVNYDANLSKNLIKVRKELSSNNPDFNEIKRITDLQNVKYNEYSSKYPDSKFANFGEFDFEKNRFKTPEEVFGTERFNELPSEIQKKIKQDYRTNKISIDVSGAKTQKEIITNLESSAKKYGFDINTPEGRLNMKKLNTSVAFQKFLKENGIVVPGCGRIANKEGGRITFSNGTCGGFKNADEFAKGDPEGFLKTVNADPKASQLIESAAGSAKGQVSLKGAFSWASKSLNSPTGFLGGELLVSSLFQANATMEGKSFLESLDQGLLWFLPNSVLNSYKKSLTEGMSEQDSAYIIKALNLENADKDYENNINQLEAIEARPELKNNLDYKRVQEKLRINAEKALNYGTELFKEFGDYERDSDIPYIEGVTANAPTNLNYSDGYTKAMNSLFEAKKQKAVKDTNEAKQFDLGTEYQKYLNDIIMPDFTENALGKGKSYSTVPPSMGFKDLQPSYQDYDILGDKAGMFTHLFPSLTRPLAPVTTAIGQAAQSYASTDLPFADKLQNYLENIAISRNKKYLTEPTTMDNLTQGDFDIANQYGEGLKRKYASGGIASLTDTIPPKSGPTPQGLPYVYNNVKKI